MRVRNPFVQGVILVAAAFVIATVSNAFASRERRLVLPGYYPNALRVPPREPERVPPPPITETTTPVPTTTIPVETDTVESEAAPLTNTAPSASEPPRPSPSTPIPAGNPLDRFKPHADKPWVEIGGEDALLLHANGVLFLDARRTSVYEEGHIAGARPFSVWESDIDDKVNALFSERGEPEQQEKPVVIYCSGGACEDSHMLAQKLWGIQFNNVYVYKDGFPDWQKRRGPVRAGGQP